MKIKVNVEDFKKLDKQLKYLNKHSVVTGVIGDNTNSEGVKAKDYAAVQEYGWPDLNIPSRPFFRTATTYPKAKAKIQKYIEDQVTEMLLGKKSAKSVYNALGTYVTGEIQHSLVKGNWVSNSKATIARKHGRNTPLRDEGTLLESINYEIRGKK